MKTDASSADYFQKIGMLRTPEQWKEVARLYRARMNSTDVQDMAKLRTYIEEGLLVAVRLETVSEIERVNRIASCGSVDSWMSLSDDDKRKWFAQTTLIDSEKARIIADLSARCEAADKNVEELTDLAYRLATGLIRARQNLFPNIDQTEVIHRDFPRIATIAKEAKC